jgi:hypothetical protein
MISPTKTKIASILASVRNLQDYSSVNVGDYIFTVHGEFVCTAKPNIMQPIDNRIWKFEQTEDAHGEPMTSGEVITIKA